MTRREKIFLAAFITWLCSLVGCTYYVGEYARNASEYSRRAQAYDRARDAGKALAADLALNELGRARDRSFALFGRGMALTAAAVILSFVALWSIQPQKPEHLKMDDHSDHQHN